MARPGSCPACGAPIGRGSVCEFCGAALTSANHSIPEPPAEAFDPPPAIAPPPPEPRPTYTPPQRSAPDLSQYIPAIEPRAVRRGIRWAKRGCAGITVLVILGILLLLGACVALFAMFGTNLQGLLR